MTGSDYRENLRPDAVFVSEIEAELMHMPPGVAEAYYVSVSALHDTINNIENAFEHAEPGSEEAGRLALHKMIVGVASYAHSVGVANAKEEEK